MINWLPCWFRQAEMKGRVQIYSRCPFAGDGTGQRVWPAESRLAAAGAGRQAPCCGPWLPGKQAPCWPAERAARGGYCSRSHRKATACEDTPLRQGHRPFLFLKLLLGLRAPPAKSDLATTGEVSRISPGPRQGWFSPRCALPDTPHTSPYVRSVTFPRLRLRLLLPRRLQPLINHPDKALILKATLPQRAASYLAYFALSLS